MRFSGWGLFLLLLLCSVGPNNVLGAVPIRGGDMIFSTKRFPSEVIAAQARIKREQYCTLHY